MSSWGAQEHWFRGRVTLEQFLKEQERRAGGELSVDDAPETTPEAPESDGDAELVVEGPQLHITELHEVRTINSGLKELAKFGFDVQSLIPQERTGDRRAPLCAPPRRQHHGSRGPARVAAGRARGR